MTETLDQDRFLWGLFISLALHAVIFWTITFMQQQPVTNNVVSQVKILLSPRVKPYSTPPVIQIPEVVPISSELQENLTTQESVVSIKPTAKPKRIIREPRVEPIISQESQDQSTNPISLGTVRSFVNETTDQDLIPPSQYDQVSEIYKRTWHQRVESISQLKYSQDAGKLQLSGEITLLVAIQSDGTLDSVSVAQTSGQSTLDQTALELVRDAAPFEPLPPNIPRTDGVFSFTSTWQFRR